MAISKLILNGEVQMDVTSDTVEANKLLEGETATKNDGTKVTGTFVAPDPVISSLSVTPTESQQTFNEASISGYKPVTVGAIASDYVGSAIPMRSDVNLTGLETYSGYKVQAQQGYYSQTASYNISAASINISGPYFTYSLGYFSGAVNITTSGYAKQSSYSFSQQLSTLSSQTITPSSESQYIPANRWLTGSQTIAAIPSSYVGSAVPMRSEADMTVAASYVLAQSGYYSSNVGVYVSSGDTSLSTSIVSSTGYVNTKLVVSAGYIPNRTINWPYILPTLSAQTITPTESVQYISSYQWLTGSQTIAAISSNYIGSAIPLRTNLSLSSWHQPAPNTNYEYLYFEGNAAAGYYSQITTSTTFMTIRAYEASTIIPSTESRLLLTSSKFAYARGSVYLDAIPSSYIIPSGTYSVTENGTYDIGSYASVDVSVAGGGGGSWPIDQFVGYSTSFRSSYGYFSYWGDAFSIGDTIAIFGYSGLYSGTTTKNKVSFSTNFIWDGTYNQIVPIPGADVSLMINATSTGGFVTFALSSGSGSFAFGMSLYHRHYGDLSEAIANNCIYGDYIDSSIRCIRSGMFYYANYLTGASCENVGVISNQAFTNTSMLVSASFPKCRLIGNNAFCRCTSLETIYCPQVRIIRDTAFSSCSNLRSIDLPECDELDYSAFFGASRLSSINLPKCTLLREGVFLSAGLTSIELPKCTQIGSYAFKSCTSLSNVVLGASRVDIYNAAFESCTSLTTITGQTIRAVYNSAFANCKMLSDISLDNCYSIGLSAFLFCSSLTSVVLDGCTYLGSSAFAYCYALSEVNLPVVKSIMSGAFYNCGSLQTVSIGSSCSSIMNYAFYRCYNLISLYLYGSSVITLASRSALMSTPLYDYSSSAGQWGTIYVPESLYSDYTTAAAWSYASSRMVSM